MANRALITASLLLSCFVVTCYGVTFSSLQRTLLVTSSPNQALKAGEDQITVSWSINQTLPAGTDSAYKSVTLKLCFAPISQAERGWRKTVDDLEKDKTCPFKIVGHQPYTPSANHSNTWTIERDIPSATYFVRAYAFNAEGHEVAYGQATDSQKASNLIEITAITGRHLSLDITSVCFSAFSIVSLAGFFFLEKRKARMSK